MLSFFVLRIAVALYSQVCELISLILPMSFFSDAAALCNLFGMLKMVDAG